MKIPRVYADTSVFGGCFDQEFSRASRRIFQEIQSGRFILILSDLLLYELDAAPVEVQSLLSDLTSARTEMVETTEETEALRNAYIEAGILPPSAVRDAGHIAIATVAEADLEISWNFKHIVHYEKIRGFNAINLLKGYKSIEIHSPKEVIAP